MKKKKTKVSKLKAKTNLKKKAKKPSFNPRIVSAELVEEGVFEIVVDMS